jgi:hypothetical protein
MTSYCYELAQWPASKAYQADHRIITPAFDILKTAQKPLPYVHGLIGAFASFMLIIKYVVRSGGMAGRGS